MSDQQFAAGWNAADSVGGAVEAVSGATGGRVPRWVVLARAVSLRAAGVDLKRHPDEEPPRAAAARVLAAARDAAVAHMTAHGLTGWAFAFNTNVRRAGVCRFPTRTRPGRIELSRHYVLRNPEAEVRDTILHEIAHALVGPGHGHDAAWKATCVRVGARPERCYGEEVEMPKGRWRATCPSCAKEFDRHRRPADLTGWFCKGCGRDRGMLSWRTAV